MEIENPFQLQLFQPEHFVYGQTSSYFDLTGVAWIVLACAVFPVGRVRACLPYSERREGSAQGSEGEMGEVMGEIAGLRVYRLGDVGLAW